MKATLVVGVAILALLLPAAARADGITANCTAGGVTAPCGSGWYTADVTVSFILPAGSSNPIGCSNQVVSSDTPGVTFSCSVSVSGSQCCRLDVTIKRDATVPTVTAVTPSRGPDVNGWYNHAVSFSAAGTASVSGIASCTSPTYSGPDSGSASVSATCTSGAGLVSAPRDFALQYDATPPTVTAAPSRPPDANGWYNHPVGIAFQATDPVSGVDSCTPTATYSGPGSNAAAVSGSCKDKAGNSASATATLEYDSTPPKIDGLAAKALRSSVGLTWKASADVDVVTIVRTRTGGKPVTLYNGSRMTTFTDRKVRSGDAYTYVVTALDQAGNAATARVKATPSGPLLAPAMLARVRGSVTLRWKAVRGASYYNVQLWLAGKKIMTTWPAGPSLRLTRLKPGRYVWFVWPGLGARQLNRYGPLVGRSTFVVTR